MSTLIQPSFQKRGGGSASGEGRGSALWGDGEEGKRGWFYLPKKKKNQVKNNIGLLQLCLHAYGKGGWRCVCFKISFFFGGANPRTRYCVFLGMCVFSRRAMFKEQSRCVAVMCFSSLSSVPFFFCLSTRGFHLINPLSLFFSHF